MDPRFTKRIDELQPRFNKQITDGFHMAELDGGWKWLDRMYRLTFADLEAKGVIFDGIKRVKPKEFIRYLKSRQPKTYETHKESYYPISINFSYRDPKTGKVTPFGPVYTMLCFADRFGDIWLRDSQYSAQIVLAERGLSVTKEKAIFFKVLSLKSKIGAEFFRCDRVHNELNDAPRSTFNLNLAANRFYSPSDTRKVTSKKTPYPLLAWYVFGNLGFTKAMELYSECDYEIGSVDYLSERCKHKDGWEVYTRSGHQPPKYLGDFITSDYAIALRSKDRKRKELPPVGLQYAGALLYVISCMSSYFDLDQIDNPAYWRLIIGRCSIKPGDPNDYVIRLMNEHFDFINAALDEDSVKKFASTSVYVKDMFELFNYIIANRSEIAQTTNRSSVLYKELASIEFIFDKLIIQANLFRYFIKNSSELSYNKIDMFLSKGSFDLRMIDNAQFANLILEPTPTDNPFSEYMLGCLAQHEVFGGDKSSNGDFDPHDTANLTHASQPFIKSYHRVTHPHPNAGGFMNPCVYTVAGNLTAIREEHQELYLATDKRLRFREIKTSNQEKDK